METMFMQNSGGKTKGVMVVLKVNGMVILTSEV